MTRSSSVHASQHDHQPVPCSLPALSLPPQLQPSSNGKNSVILANVGGLENLTGVVKIEHDVATKNKLLGNGLARVGEYQILGALGRGGYTKIKLARFAPTKSTQTKNPPNDQRVAIKVFRRQQKPKKAANKKSSSVTNTLASEQFQKFENEVLCHSLCARNSPHVVQLYAAYTTPKYLFLVEERMAGDLFWGVCVRNKGAPLPEELARDLFFQLLKAVASCHACGIGHRDIKPENILVDKTLTQLKLCDFGFATQWNPQLPRLQKSLGTVRCLPPEMIKRGSVPEPHHSPFEGDVWCCGVVLFFMLSARFPFDGSSRNETLKNITRVRYTTELPGEVSPLAHDILDLMLTRDSEGRPSPQQLLKHPFFAPLLQK